MRTAVLENCNQIKHHCCKPNIMLTFNTLASLPSCSLDTFGGLSFASSSADKSTDVYQWKYLWNYSQSLFAAVYCVPGEDPTSSEPLVPVSKEAVGVKKRHSSLKSHCWDLENWFSWKTKQLLFFLNYFSVSSTLLISQSDLPAQWACTGDMSDKYLMGCQQHSCWTWHYSLVNLMAFCYCFEVILLIFTVREGLLCSCVLLTTQSVEGLNKGVDMFSVQLFLLSRNKTAINRVGWAVLWQRKKASLNSW